MNVPKRNKLLVAVIIVVLAIAVVVVVRFSTAEDVWICDNGQWVRHGNPSAEMPQGECR